MNSQKPGFILIASVLFLTLILSLLIATSQLTINIFKNLAAFEKRQKAYYLAQAGVAQTEYLFKYEPLWQPTDPPFSGPADNLAAWLVKDAAAGGTYGRRESLHEGSFKIIWEQAKNYFYVLGFLGPAPAESALAILKIYFERTAGFQIIKQEEI